MQRRSIAAAAVWWRSPWRRTEQWLQRRINGTSSGGGTGSGAATTDLGIILAYGLGALPLALLNNIWVTYVYVFFISGPLRDSALFLLVQAVFLLWNSVNDPLFGWLSDHTSVLRLGGTQGKPMHPCLRRVRHIRLAGYMLGAAFLFAWFPWSTSSRPLAALHFLFSLCMYDGALTYLEVNHSSLLADISIQPQTRAWCNSAASLFSIFGSASSFFAHLLYSSAGGSPTGQFRLFCLGLVLLCVPAIEVSCRYIERWARAGGSGASASASAATSHGHLHESPPPEDERAGVEESAALLPSSGPASGGESSTDGGMTVRVAPALPSGGAASTPTSSSSSIITPTAAASATPLTFRLFLRQLLRHRNFALFCVVRLLQVFLCTFEKNHLSSFLDLLVGTRLSAGGRGLLISLSFTMPHAVLLLATANLHRVGGVYYLVRALLRAKIFAALAMIAALAWATSSASSSSTVSSDSAAASAVASPASVLDSSTFLPALLVLYLCGSRIVTECVCRLVPLVTSSLVDEDRVLHLRPSSMAATLIGTSSLLAKPGESLAPMLGWKVLNLVGGEEGATDAAAAADGEHAASEPRKQALLYLLLTLPLITVGIQLVLWSAFSLKGAYLRHITQRVKELEDGSAEGSEMQPQHSMQVDLPGGSDKAMLSE